MRQQGCRRQASDYKQTIIFAVCQHLTSRAVECGVFYLAPSHALFVPKGTPADVIAKLNRAAVDALADPTVRSRLTDLGQDIPPREQQTPQALGALHQAEIEKWWPIIKAAGVKAE